MSASGTTAGPRTRGPVLRPGDPRLARELAGANTAVRHHDPVVVGAAGPDDVRAAVRWATDNGRPLAVQATGHGGVSSDGAVVVTTGRMDGCRVDAGRRTCRVEAGVRWQQVVDAAADVGLAPANGTSPDVGVVGYTTAGGGPVLGRGLGFAVDHVVSVDVVTADGRLRHADAVHDPDLFWAVRGGRGSFGVVTAMEFDLFPVRRVAGGTLVFAAADVATVLAAYPAWARSLPTRVTTAVAVMRLPDVPSFPASLRGRTTLHVRIAHTGSLEAATADIAPLLALARPVHGALQELPYRDVAAVSSDPRTPMPLWDIGMHLRHVDAAAVDTLLQMVGPGPRSPLTMVELRPLDGAFARDPERPSAAGGRGAGWQLGVKALCPPGAEDDVHAAGGALVDAMDPWWDGTVPLGYNACPRLPRHRARAWPGHVLARLLDVKRVYDPHNTFRTGFAVEEQTP